MDDKLKKPESGAAKSSGALAQQSSSSTSRTAAAKEDENDEFYLNNDDDDDDDPDEDNDDDDEDENYNDDDDDFDGFMDDADDIVDTAISSKQKQQHTSAPKQIGQQAAAIASPTAQVATAGTSSSDTKANTSSSSLVTRKSVGAATSGEESLSSSIRSAMLASRSGKRNADQDEEFKFDVLTPDKIVQHMIECIKEVNQVLELTPTTTRILLHHFRWDKEKLMERFYDGDQDRLFKEAHIVSPFRSAERVGASQKTNRI